MVLLQKIEDKLCLTVKIFAGATLFFQVTVLFAGVICRYFFNNPLPWVDEIAAYLLAVLTYMGGYVALREGRLAKITFLFDITGGVVKKLIIITGNIMMMTLMAAATYYSYLLCASPVVLNQITPTIRIPMIVFYAFIPVSAMLMFFSLGMNCISVALGAASVERGKEATID